MRDIKFRVWEKHSKSFKYIRSVFDLQYWTWKPSEGPDKPLSEMDWEQYTGLKDKNGVEIYEGDVVKMDDEAIINPNGKQVIVYYFGVPTSHQFGDRFHNTDTIHDLCRDRLGSGKPKDDVSGEITGNIHEANK